MLKAQWRSRGLFTNTWICPNVSCKTRVGRFNLHSLSRVVVVHILKLLTVEKFQTSNTRKKIGYLYQGVCVAMGSLDFILIKHNGNYKMEKPAIYIFKKTQHIIFMFTK